MQAYVVIQTASSLTLKVLGTVKNALVVYLGVAVLAEQVTPLQASGYGLSLAAFFWYQHIKMSDVSSPLLVSRATSLAPRSPSNIDELMSVYEDKGSKEEDGV
jgi:hypothetical protein